MAGTKFIDSAGLSHFSSLVKSSIGTKANSSDVLIKTNTSPYTPSTDYNPATKKYVDDIAATINTLHYQQVDITTYPTLEDFLDSTGEEGNVYLYPLDTTDLSKGYYQYIWEDSDWLSLGTTTVDLSDYAPIASPAFTGNPTAPTATAGTSTTQIATTAFVQGEIGNATISIQKNGTTIDTFTTNASSNKTISISVPTDLGDLTNTAGYTKNEGTVTKITAGSGLSAGLSGDITTSGTINHSNSVTATTGSAAVYPIKIDAQGHISDYGTALTPITGTGTRTSGYLAKFSGQDTVTNGPQLGSDTTTFLRNDGSWAIPTNTDVKVKQTSSTSNANYPLLASSENTPTSGTAYESIYNTSVTVNPSTGNISATGLNVTTINGQNVGVTPKFTDTDTKVVQTAGATNANYPILASNQTSPSSGTAYQSIYDTDITINPSTGDLRALKLNGATIGNSPVFTDTWQAMTGATSSANGTIGYINAVPPKTGYNTLFWRADGSWASPAQSSYAAGTGLTLTTNTFNHSNAITAQTTQGFYPITIDAEGHISAYGDAAVALTDAEIDTIWANASAS